MDYFHRNIHRDSRQRRTRASAGTKFVAEGCRGGHGYSCSSDTGSACATLLALSTVHFHTDPEVAWVGMTEDQAKAQGIKVKKGLFSWTASGRAIANGRGEGVTKLLFDDSPEAHGHAKILGGGMVGTHAGDMIGEIALAIEMGADAVDIGKTIHQHPTLGESIGMAAEVAHGSCTDVPPARK